MPIFYEPDATKYPSQFLEHKDVIKCPGLEALTGTDFAICRLPIPPTKSLAVQIKNRALFVQVKIGYDICSFDQLHQSIASMQSCKIPKGQAVLLPIGDYGQDDDGLLKLKGQRAYGNTKYETLGTIYDMWSMRGGTVEPLPPKDIDGLMAWIERKQKSIDKIEKEGTRDIYRPAPAFEPDDIWQEVKDIQDWRKFLVSGIPGFGSKTANSIFNYVRDELPESEYNFYYVLHILTDEDEKGKALHNVPLWGDKSRKDLREKLGLPDGWNMGQLMYRYAFYQGFQSFGNDFVAAMKRRKKLSPQAINEILGKLMNEAKEGIDTNGHIPF